MEKQLTIQHNELELKATLHYPTNVQAIESNNQKRPIIVICHGFVGSRIGVDRLFVKAARTFSEQGNFVLRFDYGGCGESTGEYGELGFDSMVDQTRSVLDYVDPAKVTLLGHSLGGAVSIMTAVKDRRVKRLILWSAVGYPFNDIVNIVGRNHYDEAYQTGKTDHLGFVLTPTFFNSLMEHQPFQVATKFAGDVLIIHGTSDDVIPADYAFLYQKVFWTRTEGTCEKVIIFQGNHTYSTHQHQQEAIGATLSWLNNIDEQKQEWFHWSI